MSQGPESSDSVTAYSLEEVLAHAAYLKGLVGEPTGFVSDELVLKLLAAAGELLEFDYYGPGPDEGILERIEKAETALVDVLAILATIRPGSRKPAVERLRAVLENPRAASADVSF